MGVGTYDKILRPSQYSTLAGMDSITDSNTTTVLPPRFDWGIFGENLPLFGPENCVHEIALVSLVGVGTYKIILRPSQYSTLADMDPLSKEILDQEKQLIEANKSDHPTVTLAMTLHKPLGEANLYAWFEYDPLKIF